MTTSNEEDKDLPPLWSPSKIWPCYGGGGGANATNADGSTPSLLTQTSARPVWATTKEHGSLLISRTPESIFCLQVTNERLVELGRASIPEEDPVTALAAEVLSGDDLVVLTAHRSTLIRLWKGAALAPAAAFKARHAAPIAHLSLSPTSGLLYSAASGADFTVRAWDLNAQTCLRVVRGLPARPTCLAHFSPPRAPPGEEEEAVPAEFFAAGSAEGHLSVGTAAAEKGGGSHDPTNLTIFNHHKSPVAAIATSAKLLVSLGKDNVLAVYRIGFSAATGILVFARVVPIFHEANALAFLPPGAPYLEEAVEEENANLVLTAGATGTLAVWDVVANRKAKLKDAIAGCCMSGVPIDGVNASSKRLQVLQEDILICCPVSKKKKKKQTSTTLSLNFNQVTDATLVANRYLVIAQGSKVVKCYDLQSESDEGEDASDDVNDQLCVASTEEDAVLVKACQSDSNKFAVAGRGSLITIWEVTRDPLKLVLRSRLKGHASSVTAVHFSGDEVVTADKDGIVKLWKVDENDDSESSASALVTVRAHEKEITCLSGQRGTALSALLVSGSQDKTGKVWTLSSSSLVATLTGHRRAVTCATFSPFEDLLATASSDLTVRLWGARADFRCLRTLEGLSSWPTNLVFLDDKNLALSAHSGLLHLANTPQDQVEAFDHHRDPVWGMCVHRGKVVTLGETGEVVFWSNNSEVIAKLKMQRKKAALEQDQSLSNCLQSGDATKALNLAIKLDRPQVTLNILRKAYERGELEATLESVRERHRGRLVSYVRNWNTKTRLAEVVQRVQKFLLTKHVLKIAEGGGGGDSGLDGLEGLKAYNEKHLARINALCDRLAVVDALLESK